MGSRGMFTLSLKLRLHYNELAQRTAAFVDIRWYTLKKSDECDHLGLTYRTETEFQTTPERTHNVLVANDKRVSTNPQRTPNVLRVLSACPLRTLCVQSLRPKHERVSLKVIMRFEIPTTYFHYVNVSVLIQFSLKTSVFTLNYYQFSIKS